MDFIYINFSISGGPGMSGLGTCHVTAPHTGNVMAGPPPPPKFHLGFDDGMNNAEHYHDESHVSTPRKVIREIIV